MSQFFRYPPSAGGAGSNASVGVNGATAPTSSTEIAGVTPAGNLQPVSVDTSGNQNVNVLNFPGTQPVSGTVTVVQPTGSNLHAAVDSLPSLPAGANAIGSVSVSNFPATQPVSGTVAVSSLPSIPAGANAIGTVGVTSLPSLPAGANAIGSVSVSNFPATQPVSGTVAVSSLPSIPAGANAIGSVSVSNLPATQTVAGTVTVTQATGTNLHVVVDSGSVTVSALPSLPAGTNLIGSIKTAGKAIVAPVRNAYASTNVTTGAYVQLVASLASAVSEIEIFDSSGQTLQLAVGAPGSEVVQIYIFPGGNGRVPLAIAAGSRIAIQAVSATANSGEIDINFYS